MQIKHLFMISLLLTSSIVQSQSFNLTVNDGYGSGIHAEGDTVHIWSTSVFGDSIFTDWTGNGTNYLTFDNEWHTSLIVPLGTGVGNVTINANFEIIPPTTEIDSISYLLFGENSSVQSNVIKKTFYAIPPSPKGIVLLLHGTDGKGKSFFDKYERYSLIKDLIYDGFAVFTLDANERTMGDQNGDGSIRWDNYNAGLANSSTNIDILNIETLRDSVISTFSFPQNIPTFTIGVSAGANFSDICSSALGFNASAHITAKGKTATYTRTDIVPILWVMSENDQNQSANNVAAYSNYLTMNGNQTAEWHLFKRSPIYSNRFIRSLNNISDLQSDSIFQRLQINGYLNVDNLLTVLDISFIPISLFSNLGLTAGQKSDIYQQLLCVNADHVLHSDYNKNIIRFFNQELYPLSISNSGFEKKSTLIYPNPNNGNFYLQIESSYNDLNVSVFSITGNRMLTVDNQTEIDLSKFVNGTYFVRIVVDGKPETKKTIKIE